MSDEPVLNDGVPVQLTHLVSKRLHGKSAEHTRGIIFAKETCCGLGVNDLAVFRKTHCIELTTCEECKSGYALEVLAEVP